MNGMEKHPPASRAEARAVRRAAPVARTPEKPPRPRRSLWSWRRANRRITVERRSLGKWLGTVLAGLGWRLLFVGKMLAALAALVAALYAGQMVVAHVAASPRFALREIRVGATQHIAREEIVGRTGVSLGDRLLAIDTDEVAARLARHPWIAGVRVRRELPATLVVDVTERTAAAVAVIGGLYLVDQKGHPFKRATLLEAQGLVVLTGISRPEYLGLRAASEAAFREALAVQAEYQHPDSLAAARTGAAGSGRPPLSEIHLDPRGGLSLFLYDGGGEIRLGRGGTADKLARLDEILAELGPANLSALRVVYLDGRVGDRVPIRLAPLAEAPSAPAGQSAKPTARN
jgi:cell division protein FtsQ